MLSCLQGLCCCSSVRASSLWIGSILQLACKSSPSGPGMHVAECHPALWLSICHHGHRQPTAVGQLQAHQRHQPRQVQVASCEIKAVAKRRGFDYIHAVTITCTDIPASLRHEYLCVPLQGATNAQLPARLHALQSPGAGAAARAARRPPCSGAASAMRVSHNQRPDVIGKTLVRQPGGFKPGWM